MLRAQVGPTDHVICALSGGVDSTVAATLVHQALGDRLHCVFVDNGLLRYKVSACLYPPASVLMTNTTSMCSAANALPGLTKIFIGECLMG